MTNKEKIIQAFFQVKSMGWVRSHRSNNTGIGKTFEDCIGVIENNLNEPDLFGFEIKAHRGASASYVTLFTKSPSFPSGANAYLKDKFGENYPNSEMKKLHTSMFANSFNSYADKYSFKLIHNKDERRIYIAVYTLSGGTLLDSSVYYTYDDIERALTEKLHSLFYVRAQRRKEEDNTESFFFDYAEIYTEPSIEKFLKLLDEGKIMYDIRIGSYSSGKNYGKPHDHGSGFRIKEENIMLLYANKEVVEQKRRANSPSLFIIQEYTDILAHSFQIQLFL